MPHICLARNDIPNGSVQILDLKPNTSQPQPRTALGQTKYVNRTVRGDMADPTGAAALNLATANTVITTEDIEGLTAYILDAIEPCNTASSSARINIALQPQPNDTIVFTTAAGANTVTFVNGAPGANQVQLDAAPATAAGTSARLATFLQATPAFGVTTQYVAASQNVDITTIATTGANSAIGLTTVTAAPNTIFFYWGGNTVATTRTRSTQENFNLNTINRVTAAIQALVDAGSALTGTLGSTLSPTVAAASVTDEAVMKINTSTAHGLTSGDAVGLTGFGGAAAAQVNNRNWVVTVTSTTQFTIQFNNVAGNVDGPGVVNLCPLTVTTGQLFTVANLLKVLSGTGYKLASGTTLYSPLSIGGGQFTQNFHAALAGSFVEDVTTDNENNGAGYWKTDAAPIPVILPVAPNRPTYSGAAFNLSISQGVLQQLAAGPTWNLNTRSFMNGETGLSGRALTLAGAPIRSYAYQGNRANLKAGFATANPGGLTSLSGLRLVTVYDDAGNVLV